MSNYVNSTQQEITIDNAIKVYFDKQEENSNAFLKQIEEELKTQLDEFKIVLQEKWRGYYEHSRIKDNEKLSLRQLLGLAYRVRYAKNHPEMEEEKIDKETFNTVVHTFQDNNDPTHAKSLESISKLLSIARIGYKGNNSPVASLREINSSFQKTDSESIDTDNYPHVREVKDLLVWACVYHGFYEDEYKTLYNEYLKINMVVEALITLYDDFDYKISKKTKQTDFERILTSLQPSSDKLDVSSQSKEGCYNAYINLWSSSDISKEYTQPENEWISDILREYLVSGFDDTYYTRNTIEEFSKCLKNQNGLNKDEIMQSILDFIMKHYKEFSDVKNSLNFYVNCPIVDAQGEKKPINIIKIERDFYDRYKRNPSQEKIIAIIKEKNKISPSQEEIIAIKRDLYDRYKRNPSQEEINKEIDQKWMRLFAVDRKFSIEYGKWRKSFYKHINERVSDKSVTDDMISKCLKKINLNENTNEPSRNAIMIFVMDYCYDSYKQLDPKPIDAYYKYLYIVGKESGTPLYLLNDKNFFDNTILFSCFKDCKIDKKPIDVLIEMIAKDIQKSVQKDNEFEK